MLKVRAIIPKKTALSTMMKIVYEEFMRMAFIVKKVPVVLS